MSRRLLGIPMLFEDLLWHLITVSFHVQMMGICFFLSTNSLLIQRTLRLWTLNGDCISEMVGHTSFVYKVRSFSNGEFISCGEDRSVRVWKDGNCVQIIKLPCISVWSVDVFPNGDFVCGGNDGFLRVFSRDESKRASAEDMAVRIILISIALFLSDRSLINQLQPMPFLRIYLHYDLLIFEISKQVGDVDKSKLPGSEALADRGKKDGQVVMIRNGQTVEAHQVNKNPLLAQTLIYFFEVVRSY